MLIVGTNKTQTILDTLPESYLLIDDGSVIDAITFPKRRKVTRLDFSHHTFNPLKGMGYLEARQFIDILNAIFPEGESTLTRKNSNFILLSALLQKPKTLDTLLSPSKDPAQQDAYQKIATILLSPLLNRVLCNATNFPFTGILIARLDRATLGDFDCFVIGNLLMGKYKGQVVIPDFGFYAHPGHTALMHRLTAGVHFLDEVALKIRQNLVLMETKLACRSTYADAVTLAQLAGHRPDILREDNPYNAFIDACLA